MSKNHYFTGGISLKWHGGNQWSAEVEFSDIGFHARSIAGHFSTCITDLDTAVDAAIDGLKELGIRLLDSGSPLSAYQDGESETWPMPENWRQIIAAQSERIAQLDILTGMTA